MSYPKVLKVVLVLRRLLLVLSVQRNGGYDYPLPIQPPQLDEPFPPLQDIPTYLPPSVDYPPLSTPGIDIQPPIFDPGDTVVIQPEPPLSQYLPPATQYLPPNHKITPQVKVLNMSCQENSFFKATLQITSITTTPVVDNSNTQGCISYDPPSTYHISLSSPQRMHSCQVSSCPPANMCLTVRTPVVTGLRLPEDALVTLQCSPARLLAARTHRLRLARVGGARATALRGAVAKGGTQRGMEVAVAVLRRGRGGEWEGLGEGGKVELGEEVLVRAVVKEGDGWRFSRMGPLTISSGTRSVILVDGDGCRPISMRSVCPEQPRQVGPLVTSLPMRAFLFQGTRSSDTMLLTLRMLACVNAPDCAKERDCQDNTIDIKSRLKRSLEPRSNQTKDELSSTMDWESNEASFAFKVVASYEDLEKLSELSPHEIGASPVSSVPLILLIAVVIIMGTGSCLMIILMKMKDRL